MQYHRAAEKRDAHAANRRVVVEHSTAELKTYQTRFRALPFIGAARQTGVVAICYVFQVSG